MRNFDKCAFHVLGEEHRQEAEECDWPQAIAEQRQVSRDNDRKDVKIGFRSEPLSSRTMTIPRYMESLITSSKGNILYPIH